MSRTADALVLDCSVTMAWFFNDETTTYTESVLQKIMQGSAHVPSIWEYEVANVLLIAERFKRTDALSAETFKTLLAQLSILVDYEASQRAAITTTEIARQHNLTIYDAAYLELAYREQLPLATTDKALQKAAKKMQLLLV